MKYYLVIDEGTTSARAIAYDLKGQILAVTQHEFDQLYPKPLYVEQDLNVVLNATFKSINDLINRIGDDIISLGIANQRETTVVFNRKGKAIYNAISWQCRRTFKLCDDLKKQGYDKIIKNKTGLEIDPYFSATKIYWLLHNIPHALDEARKGNLLFGTIDTYLMYILSDGKIFKTDVTNASRTMIYNIYNHCWDDELLKIFDIPKTMLSEVCPSAHLFGYTSKMSIFKKEIPIFAVAGDQQSALFGHLLINKGETKITYGTGCFILTNLGEKPLEIEQNLITTLGVQYDDKYNYVSEGSVFFAGSLIKWLRDNLGLIKTAKESESCALKVENSLGVYIIPAFTGLGAPYWDSKAKGIICGLTNGVNKNHIVRAALEAICYQVKDVLDLLTKNNDFNITKISVDGGASSNDFMMQFQADILNLEINRPDNIERTSQGIFYLLALKNGYTINDLKKLNGQYSSFYPLMDDKCRIELLNGYKKAIKKALTEHEKI